MPLSRFLRRVTNPESITRDSYTPDNLPPGQQQVLNFYVHLYTDGLIRPIADHPGFEPGTLELTALCSAVELMVKVRNFLLDNYNHSREYSFLGEVAEIVDATLLPSGPAENRTLVLHIPTSGFDVQSTLFQALVWGVPGTKEARKPRYSH